MADVIDDMRAMAWPGQAWACRHDEDGQGDEEETGRNETGRQSRNRNRPR